MGKDRSGKWRTERTGVSGERRRQMAAKKRPVRKETAELTVETGESEREREERAAGT